MLALALIAGWLVILVIGLNLFVRVRLGRELNDALQVRAQAVAATVVISDGHVAQVRESPNDQSLDSGVWVFSAGRAVARPPEAPSLQRAAQQLAHSDGGFVEDSADNARLYARPVRTSAGAAVGTIVTAVSTAGRDRAERVVLGGSVFVSVLLLLVTYPVFRMAAGRALRPMDRMTSQAAQWSALEPDRRFGENQRLRELFTLAHTLDEMLARVSGVLRHERLVSAELSHELRTPLTRILAETDLLLQGDAHDDDRTALTNIRTSALSIDKIITTLLVTARADNGTIEGRCEIASVVSDVLAAVAHEATSELAVDIRPEDLHAGIDAPVVERILAPIVANSLRFCSRRIRIEAFCISEVVVIDISNDGPGIAAEAAEHIFEPGYRMSTDDEHDGAGLGLPLARRLARASDGDVSLDRFDPVTFRVELPSG